MPPVGFKEWQCRSRSIRGFDQSCQTAFTLIWLWYFRWLGDEISPQCKIGNGWRPSCWLPVWCGQGLFTTNLVIIESWCFDLTTRRGWMFFYDLWLELFAACNCNRLSSYDLFEPYHLEHICGSVCCAVGSRPKFRVRVHKASHASSQTEGKRIGFMFPPDETKQSWKLARYKERVVETLLLRMFPSDLTIGSISKCQPESLRFLDPWLPNLWGYLIGELGTLLAIGTGIKNLLSYVLGWIGTGRLWSMAGFKNPQNIGTGFGMRDFLIDCHFCWRVDWKAPSRRDRRPLVRWQGVRITALVGVVVVPMFGMHMSSHRHWNEGIDSLETEEAEIKLQQQWLRLNHISSTICRSIRWCVVVDVGLGMWGVASFWDLDFPILSHSNRSIILPPGLWWFQFCEVKTVRYGICQYSGWLGIWWGKKLKN